MKRRSNAKISRKSNPVTIKTDKKWHDFVYRNEVPAKVLKSDFDWLDEDELDHFIKYRQDYLHLSQFERIEEPGWDGVFPQSYFSGLLIKVSPDGEQYKIGYYFE